MGTLVNTCTSTIKLDLPLVPIFFSHAIGFLHVRNHKNRASFVGMHHVSYPYLKKNL